MGVTIYYCLCALFKTEALNLIFYFSVFIFLFDDQRSLQPGFYCICFWSLLSSIGKTTVCVFLAVVCINLFTHPFCPFIEKIKKLKYTM